MKFVKIIGLFLVAFVGIQFIPTNRNQDIASSTSDFLIHNHVPKSIKNKIQNSCYDCHSNSTRYPWYNRVQPIAWFLEKHIKEGKEALNFSNWDSLSDRQKNSKLNSIIKQIEQNEMPLKSYKLLHRETKITPDEKMQLVDYFKKIKDSIK